MRALVILLLGRLLSGVALAQTSGSYKLQEHVFNNGGDPLQGNVLAASHYRIKLDAIGGGVVATGIGSASYHLNAGFVAAYPPPREVAALSFSNKTTLQWAPERSAGAYETYRNALTSLPGAFGDCFVSNLSNPTVSDSATPAVGAGYFYLVTVRNRLGEEGTKGFATGGERSNPSPCP